MGGNGRSGKIILLLNLHSFRLKGLILIEVDIPLHSYSSPFRPIYSAPFGFFIVTQKSAFNRSQVKFARFWGFNPCSASELMEIRQIRLFTSSHLDWSFP